MPSSGRASCRRPRLPHSIRDAAQVENAVHWASRLDERGQLAPLFDPMSQEDPDRNEARDEGWILGFTCRQ